MTLPRAGSMRSPSTLASSLVGLLGLVMACQSNDAPAATPGASGMAAQAGTSNMGGSSAGSATAGAAGAAAGTSAGGAATLPNGSFVALGPFSTCVVGADQAVKCAGRCGP